MLISVEELGNIMTMGEIDQETVGEIKDFAKKKGFTHIKTSEEELLKLAKRISKGKTKDEVRKEFKETCQSFTGKSKEAIVLVVLSLVLAAALGLMFSLGYSYVKNGEEKPAESKSSDIPMA